MFFEDVCQRLSYAFEVRKRCGRLAWFGWFNHLEKHSWTNKILQYTRRRTEAVVVCTIGICPSKIKVWLDNLTSASWEIIWSPGLKFLRWSTTYSFQPVLNRILFLIDSYCHSFSVNTEIKWHRWKSQLKKGTDLNLSKNESKSAGNAGNHRKPTLKKERKIVWESELAESKWLEKHL